MDCTTCHSSPIFRCVFVPLQSWESCKSRKPWVKAVWKWCWSGVGESKIKRHRFIKTANHPLLHYSDVGAGLGNLDKWIKQTEVPSKQQWGMTTIKGTPKFSLFHWKPIFCSSPTSRNKILFKIFALQLPCSNPDPQDTHPVLSSPLPKSEYHS